MRILYCLQHQGRLGSKVSTIIKRRSRHNIQPFSTVQTERNVSVRHRDKVGQSVAVAHEEWSGGLRLRSSL